MSTRGPLPLLIYSGGVGLQEKYHIWYYTISYGARQPVSCTPYLVGWVTSDGAAHVLSYGYRGSYPPQLVPERLVSFEQRCLEQVRAL